MSIGSDAHHATNVFKGFEAVREILKEIGFEYYVLPWDKEKYLRI